MTVEVSLGPKQIEFQNRVAKLPTCMHNAYYSW